MKFPPAASPLEEISEPAAVGIAAFKANNAATAMQGTATEFETDRERKILL